MTVLIISEASVRSNGKIEPFDQKYVMKLLEKVGVANIRWKGLVKFVVL